MTRKKFSRLWILPIGTLLIMFGGLVGLWQSNAIFHAHAASSLPYHMTADGPYHVQGNSILDTQGQPYLFHGMGRDGLEYSCTGDGPLDAQHLAYMGAGASSSSGTYWWGNTIRLPVSEGYWLNGDTKNGCSAAQYQTLVKTTISTINALGLNAILDLQWVDAGGHSPEAGSSWPAPDADSLTFWQQAATLYKSSPNVLFEIYNEPNSSSWACWQAGCSITSTTYADSCSCHITATYQAVGMQALVNAIRSAGATNLILAAGLNYGFDLSGVSTSGLTGSNIVYDTHPYPYVGKETQANWDASFGTLSATTPVISTESGEYDCKSTFESSLLSYFDSHQISWMGWAWSVQGTATSVCGYPQTVTDYQGTPAPLMGQAEYQHLLSYVPAGTQPPPPPGSSNPPPSTPPGPVQKTWYFAEGRVGKGFREYLTVENPSGNLCSAALNYNYTPDGGTPATKAVSITINPYSRFTESVNADLGDADSGTSAATVAASVNVNATVTPGCTGVVVERPMYFHNFQGISSGTDVVGATHLSTTYSFADVASSAKTTSYLTILNPNNTSATVTVSYAANGTVVGSQTTTVPANARGTIAPGAITLPAHVAAVVTASQPVLVERPTYFSGVSINGTPVSGAYDIIGASSLANDWLFAEGYTSATSQEYLTLANVDPAHTPANVTITLKSKTGVTHAFSITVGAQSQTIWNVNANNTFAGSSPEVSAEVVSTGAQIVVQREMYFTYHHTLTTGRQTTALGGTDVMGQVGPAAHSSYSFAEGYANTGYNDWLTVQNPTASPESIAVTLVNGLGQSSVQNFTVPANARFTEDLASTVQQVFHAGTNSSANSFSMTVQTLNGAVFVAERPIYFNTNGASSFAVQGGNDCIGYVGG